MSEGTPIIVKKKKVKSHGGHHGGSWKVAYADFVTAMMAFFMVMWIMGLSDDTRAQIQGYFNDPLGFVKNQPKSKSIMTLPGMPTPKPGEAKKSGSNPIENKNLQVEKIKEAIEDAAEGDPALQNLIKNIDIEVTEEGIRVEFIDAQTHGAVFFETGSATITPEAQRLVSKIMPAIINSKMSVVIEGHTDAMPYPSDRYTNWDLSNDRAQSLRRLMMAEDFPEHRILAISGYADQRLKRPKDPTHFSNRRVTLLLPFATLPPMQDELPGTELDSKIPAYFRDELGIAPDPIKK